MWSFKESITYAKHNTSHIWVTVGLYRQSKDYLWKFGRDKAERNEEADYDKLSGAKTKELKLYFEYHRELFKRLYTTEFCHYQPCYFELICSMGI